MKKTALLIAVLLACLVVGASAQSGRRVKPEPTPVPTPQAPRPEEYSESKPNNVILPPASEKKSKKEDKKKKNETPAKDTTETTAPTGETIGEEEDAIKIETNLITIPVSVYERSGVYVGGLRQADFKIFEDGKEQEIAYFGNTSQPFSVILLIDTSSSTTFKIEEIQDAAIAFVEQLNPEDKVMVISFDSGINVLTDFTNERQKIHKAIRQTNFGGATRLYDAVRTSLNKQLAKVAGRKAIVLFTDGVDTASMASDTKTLELAEEADSMVFPIYYNTFLDNRGLGGGGGVMSTPPIIGGVFGAPTSADYARGRVYLEALAQLTGGKMFRAESTVGGLNAAFEGIAKELRSQYSIGYYPAEEGTPGQRKQIKVRVNRANVAIRARDSYIVGAHEASKKKTSK